MQCVCLPEHLIRDAGWQQGEEMDYKLWLDCS